MVYSYKLFKINMSCYLNISAEKFNNEGGTFILFPIELQSFQLLCYFLILYFIIIH